MRAATLMLLLSIPSLGYTDVLKLVCEFGQGTPISGKPVSEDWESIRLDSAVFAIEIDTAEEKAYSDWFPVKYVTGTTVSMDDEQIMWFLDMSPAGSGYRFLLNRHTGTLFVRLQAGEFFLASEGKCTKPEQLF